MMDDEMICYSFIFYGDDPKDTEVKDIWAHYETEAWRKADSYAFKKGYLDYKLIDEDDED